MLTSRLRISIDLAVVKMSNSDTALFDVIMEEKRDPRINKKEQCRNKEEAKIKQIEGTETENRPIENGWFLVSVNFQIIFNCSFVL